MKKNAISHLCLFSVLSLICGFGVGCTSEDGASLCGQGASGNSQSGTAYCVYENSIIENGFRCPEARPVLTSGAGRTVCAEEPIDAGEIVGILGGPAEESADDGQRTNDGECRPWLADSCPAGQACYPETLDGELEHNCRVSSGGGAQGASCQSGLDCMPGLACVVVVGFLDGTIPTLTSLGPDTPRRELGSCALACSDDQDLCDAGMACRNFHDGELISTEGACLDE